MLADSTTKYYTVAPHILQSLDSISCSIILYEGMLCPEHGKSRPAVSPRLRPVVMTRLQHYYYAIACDTRIVELASYVISYPLRCRKRFFYSCSAARIAMPVTNQNKSKHSNITFLASWINAKLLNERKCKIGLNDYLSPQTTQLNIMCSLQLSEASRPIADSRWRSHEMHVLILIKSSSLYRNKL